jgi:hypothetical protein
MRKVALILLGVFVAVLSVSAQEGENPPELGGPLERMSLLPDFSAVMEKMGLDEEEIEKAGGIQEAAENRIKVARAEQEILKAKLKRELINTDADIDTVEEILRDSLEWELEIQLAQIERDLELRNLLGDDAWARMNLYLRNWREKFELEDRLKSLSGRASELFKNFPPGKQVPNWGKNEKDIKEQAEILRGLLGEAMEVWKKRERLQKR